MGYAIGIPLGILLGAVGALLVRWLLDKRAVENVGTRAEEILRGAKHEAENIRKAAELAAKDEALKKRERVDAEVEEKRKELRDVERRLDRREEAQEKKGDQLARKEEELSGRSAELSR
ncbi:MAG: Rnase Y domain-containing protein, partial [Planctomycetota bacterium]